MFVTFVYFLFFVASFLCSVLCYTYVRWGGLVSISKKGNLEVFFNYYLLS